MNRITTSGPGSDPNPIGNLSHMRQVAYLVDMERGGGSSPLTGRMMAGNIDIIRGSGILGVNFTGVVIDKNGVHIYGGSNTRALFFRTPDGTLAGYMHRVTATVDSGGTSPAGTIKLVTSTHEVFFDLNGHEMRIAGDFYPAVDSQHQLGEDDTPRRWSNVHTDTITFADGTSFSGNSYSSSRINLIAGENITNRYSLYIHTDGKVYHATAAKRSVTIGHARTAVSSGAAVLVSLNGVFNATVAGDTITPGDFLHADSVTAGRVISGATFGSGEVLGIAIGSATSGSIITYMTMKA